MTLILWHGSPVLIERFDASQTQDGGFHFGSQDQARMRNPTVLHEVEVDIGKARRCKDRGGDWKGRIRDAKAAGFSAIVYLNRYEGMTAEIIARLQSEGRLSRLDDLSDAEFRKLVPEAQDSHILWDPDRIRIISTLKHAPENPYFEDPASEGP